MHFSLLLFFIFRYCYFATTLEWKQQDLSTVEGVISALDHAIKDREGELFGTWWDYIYSSIETLNSPYAKQIVLFLSKERHRECTRDEISHHIDNQLSEDDLIVKLNALLYGDLITQRINNFRYRGIPDDILDLIFRELFQEEVDHVKPNIPEELRAKLADLDDTQSL